jgi:hypothetical protein
MTRIDLLIIKLRRAQEKRDRLAIAVLETALRSALVG